MEVKRQTTQVSKKRPQLLARVGQELGRELTTRNLFLHTLIAGKVGLNVTDTRCLDILSRAGPGPMTAGGLKDATGLTTGAVTGILDRLENAGFARRVRDASDRRKVFVELIPDAGSKLAGLYDEIGSEMEKLASSYTTRDLEVIGGFLEANLEILKRQIARFSATPGAPR
jgi:DNA-binding MarR family transcriptional regulator